MSDSTKENANESNKLSLPESCFILPPVTEQEKELAANAFQEFENKNYEKCKSILNKLSQTRSGDPKILHNLAVVEYYQSEFRNTDELQKKIKEVCDKAQVNIDNVDGLDDVDHCVIFFNQAVILYHSHQYNAALNIMDKLFQFIEPLDDQLAIKTCLLLLELYLCVNQPEKAARPIAYMENMLYGNNKTSSNGSKAQTPEKEKEREGSKEKEVKEKKETTDSNFHDIYKPKLQQYKARFYLMLKSTKACRRELKTLMSTGVSVSGVYLRSQLEYLRNNCRKAMKLLNTASVSVATHTFKETGDNIAAMYYNNMGCLHFYMGKPNLGCFYFNKAVQEHNNAIKSLTEGEPDTLSSRPLFTVDVTAYYQLMYNLGLQYLHAGKPLQAFERLLEAVQVYHTNPRLWLRLAECCMQNHKPDNSRDFSLKERQKDMIRGSVGSGPHRKIIMSPFISNDNKLSVQGQSSAIPMPTLEFASLCLRNALILIPDSPSPSSSTSTTVSSQGGSVEESEGASPVEGQHVTVNGLPANSIQGAEVANLKNSILVASAYVALCLGDMVMALKHAETLLSQPRISGAHKFLAHLYAAEASIMMDDISDAIQYLSPDTLTDISLTLPLTLDSGDPKFVDRPEESSRQTPLLQGWYPNTLSTAKVLMQYHLTVAYAIRGELDKAGENLSQVGISKGPGTDIPVQAVMLAIYIQLQKGLPNLAKSIIKQYLPQYR
ncbi:CCR4-NOT transcription complex subunit 10 isoform X1 [Tachypleus tridentatus]|uniref:CCR4-NOT transcription complex subunit 10 isoform X1 n=1 Tax=Tachypleus tridentatus TaxID=6853 RepID=UPI003FCEEB9D